MPRRKPHKIRSLPREIVDAVNARLAEGHTYEDIAAWLTDMGHPVGKSSVGRYAKDWSAIAGQVREAQAQAQVLVQELRERPNSVLAEATEQMILTIVANAVAEGRVDVDGANPVKIGHMIADLQRSAMTRERMKLQFRKEFLAAAEKAADDAARTAKAGGLSDEAVEEIRGRILGIAG